MAYIGKSPSGTGVRQRYYFTATGGETSLSGTDDNGLTLSYSDGAYVDVLLNGIELVAGTDYNTSTANTIAGLAALAASDVVTVTVYDIFTVADTVSAKNGGTFSGNVVFNGNINAGTIKDATGTNTGLIINSAGIVTQPNKPMFRATGSDNQVIADNSLIKIAFNSEDFDVGGYYDHVTDYRYKPLVAGKYKVGMSIYFTYVTAGTEYLTGTIKKNGTDYHSDYRFSTGNNYGSVNVDTIIDMNGSTDYIEAFGKIQTSSDARYWAGDNYGEFYAYLIG